MIFAHILSSNKAVSEVKGLLSGAIVTLERILMNTRLAWSLTEAQDRMLKRIIRHWLIKPINAYGKPVNRAVEDYLFRVGHKSLQLDLYRTDHIIQQTVHTFIAAFQNSHRSNLRKKVFTSVKNGQSLRRFANKLIDTDYEGKDPSVETSKAIHAQVALMRKTARPLVKKKGKKGGNTGFWGNLNGALRGLIKKNGEERGNAQWVAWYDEIIKEDEVITGPTGDAVMSEDEDEDNDDLEYDERGATEILGEDEESLATVPTAAAAPFAVQPEIEMLGLD
ncbi:hypothetical protein DENSPDRAFT_848632 [Dentipellis sp. KUC8613]|nr:hypothetical protein DENSPDRAFT_848632 [Dentipellis sp. KUC8613]